MISECKLVEISNGLPLLEEVRVIDSRYVIEQQNLRRPITLYCAGYLFLHHL